MYIGNNKFEALKPLVKDNEQPQIDKVYSVNYTEGVLVVAYPNEGDTVGIESDFEFSYQLVATVIKVDPKTKQVISKQVEKQDL